MPESMRAQDWARVFEAGRMTAAATAHTPKQLELTLGAMARKAEEIADEGPRGRELAEGADHA